MIKNDICLSETDNVNTEKEDFRILKERRMRRRNRDPNSLKS